jgi:hypothetical protein
VIGGFMGAGGVLGAVAGAARRGARAGPGVYQDAGAGPAVEVPAFAGPPLRLGAAQLRALADLLDRHGQAVRLAPLGGRTTADAEPPPP